MGHAPAPQAELGARLGARLDLDLLVAVDRRHAGARAQGGLGDRDVELVVELGALALQLGVRRDVDRDVQAARRTAPRPGLALAREADLVALVDAGRDRDPELLAPLGPAVAVARLAGLLDDPALALAARARVTLIIWPSIVWRTERTSPRPSHCGQVVAFVPGLAPVPPQVAQRSRTGNSISVSRPRIASSNVRRRS